MEWVLLDLAEERRKSISSQLQDLKSPHRRTVTEARSIQVTASGQSRNQRAIKQICRKLALSWPFQHTSAELPAASGRIRRQASELDSFGYLLSGRLWEMARKARQEGDRTGDAKSRSAILVS